MTQRDQALREAAIALMWGFGVGPLSISIPRESEDRVRDGSHPVTDHEVPTQKRSVSDPISGRTDRTRP